jgi:alcohol dehydrogenase (cytochrome c)
MTAARRVALSCLAVVAIVAAACARSAPRLPVTESPRPLSDFNAQLLGPAPDVTRGLTAARLAAAAREPANWLTYHGTYDGQRYSALDAIHAGNVAGLRPAWTFQTGAVGLIASPATYALEATPLVVDGVMFVSGFDGNVWALDAATGKTYWNYQHAIPLDTPLCCGNVNRGVAVLDGRVFYATANGHLLALDARTGAVLWDKVFLDVRAGESSTGAPLVVKDRVLVGNAGGEYGVRGHVDAFDAATGRRLWRRYTVPGPGEPGIETWSGDSWQRAGGATWVTGTYDPELDLVYWSTGNPGPDFDGSVRLGDNLYTNSMLALDPDDGAIRWHFQFTPHDVWDYDGMNEGILYDRDGRKLLAHFDKNGYVYVLDRVTGAVVSARPYARVTWADVDPTTGRATVRLNPSPRGTRICPGPAGAKEWNHAAYSPRTGLMYVPVIEMCGTFTTRPREFREGMAYWGGGAIPDTDEQWGHLKAIDAATGREVWSWKARHPMVASVLATAGDVVFTGEPTGEFGAYDAKTGALLWQHQTGSGIHGSPMTYSVKGRQYVAVTTGWGGWVKGFAPELSGAPRGGAIFAFTLP